jgi:hypothetical protein
MLRQERATDQQAQLERQLLEELLWLGSQVPTNSDNSPLLILQLFQSGSKSISTPTTLVQAQRQQLKASRKITLNHKSKKMLQRQGTMIKTTTSNINN